MSIRIRQAQPEDLAEIARIEQEIEPGCPADLMVLQARLAMFQEGFLTAWFNGKLVGYVQACIWDEKIPQFNPEPDFFSKKHNTEAETLYIIFLGVRPHYQRQGVGSRLVQSILKLAVRYSLKRVHAVTWEHMQKFYIKQGFRAIVNIADFLPEGVFSLLEYRVDSGD